MKVTAQPENPYVSERKFRDEQKSVFDALKAVLWQLFKVLITSNYLQSN